MIKINKVSSLKKERKGMTYGDLKTGDGFVFRSERGRLLLKTAKGHMWVEDLYEYTGDEHPSNTRQVIPVDAEINWCFREGE